jgi:hypothetical protein
MPCARWASRRHLKRLKAEVGTNLRILLGAGQVLSLLSGVLEIVYPPITKTALSFASIVAVDAGSFVSFDCYGLDWYVRWRLLVCWLPLGLVLLILVRWLYSHRKHRGEARARVKARNEAMGRFSFVVMLLYPQVRHIAVPCVDWSIGISC